MIISFANQASQDIYDNVSSRYARSLPVQIWRAAQRKLDMLDAAVDVKDLKVPPGNRLELLRGSWSGFYSIRINDQYRIIFRFQDGNAYDVQIMDYH